MGPGQVLPVRVSAMTYAVGHYELRDGHWYLVRVVETHTDKQAARDSCKRLQASLPGGGITTGYSVVTLEA